MSDIRVTTAEEARRLPDLKSAFKVLKSFGIEPKGHGIKTLDEAIELVVKQLTPAVVTASKGQEQIPKDPPARFGGLQIALEENSRVRETLLKIVDEVHQLFRKLPNDIQQDLTHVCLGSESTLDTKRDEISHRQCSVIVTGDSPTGQSSLINLLLGGVDLLPATQPDRRGTFCEIRTCTNGRQEATAYRRTPSDDDGDTDAFDLSDVTEIKQFRQGMEACNEEGELLYDKIEVYGPFPMLEDGIVLVNTPGVDITMSSSGHWHRYLAGPHVIIYVLDGADDVQVNTAKIQTLLRFCMTGSPAHGLDPSSVMFVCTNMEEDQSKGGEDLKKNITAQLTSVFNPLTDCTVTCQSIPKVMESMRKKEETPEVKEFNDSVKDVIKKTMKKDLNTHSRWLRVLLKRASFCLSAVSVKDGEERECQDHITDKASNLEVEFKAILTRLKVWTDGETVAIVQQLAEILQSTQLAEGLFSLNASDCPTIRNEQELIVSVLDVVMAKANFEINRIASNKGIVDRLREKVSGDFKKQFEKLEGRLATFEGALLNGATMPVLDVLCCVKKPGNVNIPVMNPLQDGAESFTGIGGVVCQTSSLRPCDRQLKQIFSNYNPANERESLSNIQDAIKLFLTSIMDDKSLTDKVSAYIAQEVDEISEVARIASALLKGDVCFINMQRNSEANQDQLKELAEECSVLQTSLDQFCFTNTTRWDIRANQLIWDSHRQESIGPLHDGQVQIRAGKRSPATVYSRKTVSRNTISNIQNEDLILRGLNHDNILQFYGSTTVHMSSTATTAWLLVFEPCKTTLQTKVFQDAKTPGKQPANSSAQLFCLLQVADLAIQICDGLKYLHDRAIVHNDLRTDCILLNDDNVVKIGLFIPKYVKGGPKGEKSFPNAFKAPENLDQSRAITTKADIYSLGVIIWEMWYGQKACEHVKDGLSGPYEDAVLAGLRPSLELTSVPVQELVVLIEQSWQRDPRMRPDVNQHYQYFDNVIKQRRRQ